MSDKRLGLYFELFNEIGILSQLSRAMFEERLEPGFLLTHFSVLNHLIRVGDGKTPLSISSAFQVPKASMTHTLTGLSKAGYIETKENQQDKRSKLIYITAAGREFRDTAIQNFAPDVNEVAKQFSEADAEAIVPALKSLRETLDKMRN
jgi:DNA-binding MarR family transcriptional regulator